jgi:hypothetical protein
MAFMVASIVLLHVVSLACLLGMARYSVELVDEEGRPIRQTGGWTERVVPRRRAGFKTRQKLL